MLPGMTIPSSRRAIAVCGFGWTRHHVCRRVRILLRAARLMTTGRLHDAERLFYPGGVHRRDETRPSGGHTRPREVTSEAAPQTDECGSASLGHLSQWPRYAGTSRACEKVTVSDTLGRASTASR